METTAPQIISIAQPKNTGVMDYVFKGALIVGAVFVGKKIYENYVKNQISDNAGSNPSTQLAMEIHQAIDGAGTNEKVLFDVASKITDWKAVSEAYRGEYHTDMTDDIKGDLSASDFQRFMSIYNLGQKNADGTPKVSKNIISAGLLVTSEKQTYIRKTPVYMKVLTGIIKAGDILNLFKNNSVALAPIAKVLGISTGKYSDDLKSDNPTRFIEIIMNMLEPKTKKITHVKVWVASSQVKTESKTKEYIAKINPKDLVTLSSINYDNALSGINNTTIKTNTPLVGVYDTHFRLVDYATKPNIILGTKVGETSNENKSMVSYKTIDGTLRHSYKEQILETT